MTIPDERAKVLEWTTRVQSPRPRLGYRIPFPEETSSPSHVPLPLSSNFQASFTQQMEAQTIEYHPDPHEIIVPL